MEVLSAKPVCDKVRGAGLLLHAAMKLAQRLTGHRKLAALLAGLTRRATTPGLVG